MKSPEFFIQKKVKRAELEEFLPSDLVLIYGAGQKPHKWAFGGEMPGRRNSSNRQDEIFFEALKKYNALELSEEEKSAFRIERAEERKKVAILISYGQQLSRGLETYAQKGWWDNYASLLKSMAETGRELSSDADAQLFRGLEACAQHERWDAYASLLKSMAKTGRVTDAQLSRGLEAYAQHERWDAYASLLKSMAETGRVTDAQLSRGLEAYAQ
ncbi:MAG: hypothetical protein HZA37_01950, partial [Parcubacteria group bacterium]|nr:hypothetical protein [Parcubacteria group bacterium]